jgi:dGTP triphosphohydrolase
MLSLRAFMFEHVYLGPHTRPEHERAREVVRRIFDHLIARGDEVDDAVDYLSGMTDRFALDFARTHG